MARQPWTIRDLAEADIDEIIDFIGAENPSAALRFLEALHEDFELLAGFPGAGARRYGVSPRLHGLRSWPVSGFRNYLILYKPMPDGIEIIRVLHGARDFPRELGRSE